MYLTTIYAPVYETGMQVLKQIMLINLTGVTHALVEPLLLVSVWILWEATWVCSGRLCKTVFLIPFPAAGRVEADCSPPPPPLHPPPPPPHLIWNTIYLQSRHVTSPALETLYRLSMASNADWDAEGHSRCMDGDKAGVNHMLGSRASMWWTWPQSLRRSR